MLITIIMIKYSASPPTKRKAENQTVRAHANMRRFNKDTLGNFLRHKYNLVPWLRASSVVFDRPSRDINNYSYVAVSCNGNVNSSYFIFRLLQLNRYTWIRISFGAELGLGGRGRAYMYKASFCLPCVVFIIDTSQLEEDSSSH